MSEQMRRHRTGGRLQSAKPSTGEWPDGERQRLARLGILIDKDGQIIEGGARGSADVSRRAGIDFDERRLGDDEAMELIATYVADVNEAEEDEEAWQIVDGGVDVLLDNGGWMLRLDADDGWYAQAPSRGGNEVIDDQDAGAIANE
jgi:hypothetical protein